MKKNILLVLITAIICIVGTASAAYVYTARDIGYQPSDENWSVDNVQEALTELKTDVNTITNKVEGIERVYKAGEVELVALVSDDSFYTDSNGKYVLSNSDTGRALLADTSTYKSLTSTSDCVGIVGADTAIPFSKQEDMIVEHMFGSPSQPYPTYTLLRDSKKLVIIVANYGGTTYCRLKLNGESIPNTYENSRSGEYRQSGFIVENVKKNDVITLDINGSAGVTIVY